MFSIVGARKVYKAPALYGWYRAYAQGEFKMADVSNAVRDELRKIVYGRAASDGQLSAYLTPEEKALLRERAVEHEVNCLARLYGPWLEKIEPQYHLDVIRFTQTGQASPEFIAYIDDDNADNETVREAMDRVLEAQAVPFQGLGRALMEGSLDEEVGK